MTGTELRILQDWADERHAETMRRFDRMETMQVEQGIRIEALQDVQFTPEERDTTRAAVRTLRWVTPRRAAVGGSLPVFGGLLVVFERIKDALF